MRTQMRLKALGRDPKARGNCEKSRRPRVMKGTSGEMGNNQPDSLPSIDVAPLVLIVEDEQPIAEALRDIVEDRGYRTITGRDGREGLDLAQKRRPDVIITDYMMPRLDGLAFIRAVREDAARAGHPPPLIILTSAIDNVPVTASSAPDDVLPKPFDLDYLEHLLDQYRLAHNRQR